MDLATLASLVYTALAGVGAATTAISLGCGLALWSHRRRHAAPGRAALPRPAARTVPAPRWTRERAA